MLDPAAYLATSSQGGGGGDTPLYSNLKVIAVPVLATILHMAPLRLFFYFMTTKETRISSFGNHLYSIP